MSLRRARYHVTVVFFLAGALFGSWAPRIPAVKADLHLSTAALGLALLGPAIGAVCSMLATGAVVARFGSRVAVRWSLVLFAAPAVLIGLCTSLSELFAVLLLWGFGIGALEVAMNAQAASVQVAAGRPYMSGFHAAYSLGGLAGAGAGSLAATAGVPLETQLAWAGLGTLAAGAVAGRGLLHAPAAGAQERPFLPKLERGLLVLGLMALGCLLCEGAAADWSAVYLRESVGASAGAAGLGFVAFSTAMAAGRLAGDRTTAALGESRLVRASAVVAAVGFGAGIAIGTVASSVAGFGLLGLGLAVVVPTLFGAAGRRAAAGPSIALVSTSGYLGFLAGPPTIGAVAATAGLAPTLGIVAAIPAAIAALASPRTL